MKRFFLSTVMALAAAAASPAFANRNDVEQAAQSLRQDLNQLAQKAQNVSDNAADNGNPQRSQRFAHLSNESTRLSQDVRQFVIRPLQQGASQAELRRSARSLNEQRLANAVQQINQMPDNIQQLVQQVRVGLRQLRAEINADWGRGGGGGGGNGQWIGDCRVVLETIWGTDLEDYFGRGRGPTKQAALNEAREDGHDRCTNSPRFGGLTRCTVDNNNCSAQRR